MTRSFYILYAVLLSGAAVAAPSNNKPKEGETEKKGGFVFSFFPKSFQKNPQLDFNVLTEMTAEGKKYPVPTEASPAYYIINVDAPQSRGFVAEDLSKNAPKPEQVERLIANALRTNHYLPEVKGGPAPTIAIIVHWGAYSSPAFNGEEATATEPDQLPSTAKELLPYVLGSVAKRKAILERATMIGGAKFSLELNGVLNEEVHMRAAAGSSDRARSAAAGPDESPEGSLLMTMLESSSPLARYMSKDPNIERMVEEVFSDSYYVVISALDLKSVAERKPILLWRTKLSLNSIGVSLAETVTPLINAGTDYFGKETDKAIVVTKRIQRGGHVEIGEARTIEYIESDKKTASPESAPPPDASKTDKK